GGDMRVHSILVAALISIPGWAAAQGATPAAQDAKPAAPNATSAGTASTEREPANGEIDYGGQVSTGLDGVGRFQTYRDPRSGPTISRFRYDRDRDTWTFSARVDNAGYRDQRYQATFNQFGRVKASFDWNQIPTWYS